MNLLLHGVGNRDCERSSAPTPRVSVPAFLIFNWAKVYATLVSGHELKLIGRSHLHDK